VIIRWTLAGTKTRFSQVQYIADQNPQAADRLEQELVTQIRILADHPNMGRTRRRPGTREWVIARTPFIVVYRVTRDHIDILRILHHAQKWPLK
jgi:toxin ParE1/3/4